MRRLLERAGVADRVWFAGERADVPEIMRGLDCFVLPSLAEGVSNTILEAMASGLPVVATRVGGNSELIESGMTGTLVPPANSDALAQAMLGYFNDRSTARRHAKAALRVVETRFSLARMVSDYVGVYERALAAAAVRCPARRRFRLAREARVPRVRVSRRIDMNGPHAHCVRCPPRGRTASFGRPCGR